MSEQNRALAGRVVEELWNQGELETADEPHSNNYLLYEHEDLRGLDAVKQHVVTMRTIFPDLMVTVDDEGVGGNKVEPAGCCQETEQVEKERQGARRFQSATIP